MSNLIRTSVDYAAFMKADLPEYDGPYVELHVSDSEGENDSNEQASETPVKVSNTIKNSHISQPSESNAEITAALVLSSTQTSLKRPASPLGVGAPVAPRRRSVYQNLYDRAVIARINTHKAHMETQDELEKAMKTIVYLRRILGDDENKSYVASQKRLIEVENENARLREIISEITNSVSRAFK